MSSTQDRTIVKFTIGGAQVDFTNLPSLTVGDKKQMKTDPKYGIDFNKRNELSPEDESKLILFIVRKMRPETTIEEVDALPIMVGQRILSHAVKMSMEVDENFLAPSTSSLPATAGAPQT